MKKKNTMNENDNEEKEKKKMRNKKKINQEKFEKLQQKNSKTKIQVIEE